MSTISRNIVWLLASQMATWLISMVVLVLVPRQLGAGDFGKIQVAGAFVGFFALIGFLGTNQVLVKIIAREHALVGPYVVNALVLKLVLSVVLSVAALLLALLIGYPAQIVILIVIGLFGMTCMLLNDSLVAGLAGMERMARPALWQTVQVYVGGILGLAVLYVDGGVSWYVLAGSLALAVPVVANFRALWPWMKDHLTVDFAIWRIIVRGGIPLLVLGAFMLLYSTIDLPILEALTDTETVGRYSLAYRWIGMPVFIASIVITAFLPSLSSLANETIEGFRSLSNKALRLILVITIPASTGIALISHDLIELLYDDQYRGAAVLMVVLSAHIPLSAIDTVLATTLIASDRHGKFVLTAGIAAVVNPLMNFPFIHFASKWFDNGAIGAATVTVLTELLILFGLLMFTDEGVMDRRTTLFGGRCLLAAGAMGLAVWGVWDLGMFVKIPVGAVVYGLASILFGSVSVSELRHVSTQLRASIRRPDTIPVPDAQSVPE